MLESYPSVLIIIKVKQIKNYYDIHQRTEDIDKALPLPPKLKRQGGTENDLVTGEEINKPKPLQGNYCVEWNKPNS